MPCLQHRHGFLIVNSCETWFQEKSGTQFRFGLEVEVLLPHIEGFTKVETDLPGRL